MAGPMDFSLGNIPDPTAAFASGAQLGAGLRTLGIQQQQQDLQLQAQQQAMQAQQQQAAVINALINKPNANAQDYAAAVAILPKERAELIQKSWEMRNTEQQQNALQDTGKVFAALGAGQPAVASQLLRDRSTLLKTSDPQQSRALETMAGVVDAHPEFAKALIGMHLASLPGGDKVITNLSGLGTEQRAQDKAPFDVAKSEADARGAVADAQKKEADAGVAKQEAAARVAGKLWDNANTKSLIQERAARLGLDRDKLTSETQAKLMELNQKFGQLPDSAVKIVNESAIQATASAQSAGQMFDLASRLEQQGGGYGGFATAAEWVAKATGNQDAMTGMRQEFTRLMSAGVMKMLPPGPASDKDIALAREGFPPATADAKYLAQFLRGMAKLQAYDSALNNARSEWAGAVGHLGKAKTDIEVTGIKVPAGSTFPDFAKQFLAKQADQVAQSAQTQSRSYMRWAQ